MNVAQHKIVNLLKILFRSLFFISVCVFNVWSKTILILSVWLRDAKRLDPPGRSQRTGWPPNIVECRSKEVSKNNSFFSVSMPSLSVDAYMSQDKPLAPVLRETVNYYLMINISLSHHSKAAGLTIHYIRNNDYC